MKIEDKKSVSYSEAVAESSYFPLPILLSSHFHGIGSLIFSKFCYGVRNSYKVVRDRVRYLKQIFFALNGKIGQK